MSTPQKKPRPQELPLAPELQRVLDSVGPEAYVYATAREFARGGAYNTAQRRPRYAKV